jgi:hypothetical protein
MEIFETPQVVAPTDFNLSDPATNRELAKKLVRKTTETIEDSPDYTIVRGGDQRNGNIALINKHSHAIDYMVHYPPSITAMSRNCITAKVVEENR